MVAFILTMPGVASWNGRWSGEGTLYAKLDGTLGKEKEAELVAGGPYHYSWNDGWCARVEVRQVDRNEAAPSADAQKASAAMIGWSRLLSKKERLSHESI